MAPLPSEQRTAFDRDVGRARETAEAAARAALAALRLGDDRPPEALDEPGRALRRALRARARQLGQGDMRAGEAQLVEEIAYEQWHRLLFARFLAENGLLLHPSGVAVSLAECRELAAEEGADDEWDLAGRYAARMLPAIFRADDPTVAVRPAREWREKLERIVLTLPRAVFTSDDGLGWSYQFWQSRQKRVVNDSQRKIGGADIPPVTQLFTEDYMVRFLLDNTLGAWWAARRPDSPLVASFAYLRRGDDGAPAAGAFDGWPDRAADVTMIDPCGGSGHFLVAAFEMLARMRMEEEGLGAAEAGDAVIRDNVHMLEIDPRCTQIAAFNLALAAWKLGGYRPLPAAAIACSGVPVAGQLDAWLRLAGRDAALRRGLERLYELFRHAPDLGSLIDPAAALADAPLFGVAFEQLRPLLRRAVAAAAPGDPDAPLFGAAVLEAARAAELLAGKYTLVATNVPYLKRGNQAKVLQDFCEKWFPDAKAELATVFIDRCRDLCQQAGTCALVTPQNWTFLGLYKDFRLQVLTKQTIHTLCWLGPGAFETISGEVVKPILFISSNATPEEDSRIIGCDLSDVAGAQQKDRALRLGEFISGRQGDQLRNPDSRLMLEGPSEGKLLDSYAYSYKGVTTGDDPHYRRQFWEFPTLVDGWRALQTTVKTQTLYGGAEQLIWLEAMTNPLQPGVYIRAASTWGKFGVLVSLIGELPCSLSLGVPFDTNVALVLPHDASHLAAVWAFCSSPEFNKEVRKLDKKLNVTNATLVKVPFDLDYWQAVAAAQYPDGLPAPHSNDPTQWLFQGQPPGSTAPLQVAVARLLGYRWPQQPAEADPLDALADGDGIVCLPAVGGEEPAHERLRALLAAAYGPAWSPATQATLLAEVGYAGRTLAEWLRDAFFAQHCRLFHNRPFLWHVWDGRKDGFSALVNYHKLDAARLQRLIYTSLGDWIRARRADADRGEAGAEGRLVAALALHDRLAAIAAGAPPYDVYVRWKPLAAQPIGWRPDLNDGVRLNVRPWVVAGVLRAKFTVDWKKDRGRNTDGSERINDLHLTLAERRTAREMNASEGRGKES